MNSNEDENLDLIDVELDLSDEVWLPIIGYDGKYELSNYGRVRNVKRGRGLKVQKSWNQIRCSLSRDNKYADFSVSSNMDKYFPEGHYFNPSDYTYLNTLSSCNSPMEQLDDLPGEYWKNIQGFDDVFYISNIGRIKSASRELTYPSRCGNPVTRMTKEKMLVLRPTRYGYIQTNLAHNGVNTMWFVHRLVAIAFIPNPYNFPHVNHIDGDKTNNSVENLEWITPKENIAHAISTGLLKRGANSKCAKLTWEEVRHIRNNTKLTRQELALLYEVNVTTIVNVIKYKTYKNDPMEENK